ncbi:cation:proton antiporter [Amycolatopsis sp. NPDC059021]|uniref:cation:proton antiporter n=1 Tax=Amycolatopsis sp. NPDC059021 TaxID=3346704 RepID=UPI00366FD704
MKQSLLTATAVVLLWALTAARLARWRISAPIVMVTAGLAIGFSTQNVLGSGLNTEIAQHVAEIMLALLLFVDATALGSGYLGRDGRTVARLLFIALPLSLLAIMGIGLLVLPGLSWAVVLLIACIITPTDFAPTASVVRDFRIPERVRHILNVESGYNDGIIAPVFVFALTLAGDRSHANSPEQALKTAVPAAILAVVTGIIVGAVTAMAMNKATEHEWASDQSLRIATVAVPLLTYSVAVPIGGNGFVAAFVCGIAYKATRHHHPGEAELGLVEDVTSLSGMALWFVFGSATVLVLQFGITWGMVVLALAALTIARAAPVLVTLLGTDLRWRDRFTVAFLAPRGVASIVFGLLAFNSLDGDDADIALIVTALTVLGSVLAHGIAATAWTHRKAPQPSETA